MFAKTDAAGGCRRRAGGRLRSWAGHLLLKRGAHTGGGWRKLAPVGTTQV
ncbi:MAG: hypothetical protein ACK4SN_07715 [Bellilinea sp.]